MNGDVFMETLKNPTVDFYLSNGDGEILDVEQLVSLLNFALTDLNKVSSVYFELNLAIENLYSSIREEISLLKRSRELKFAEYYELYADKKNSANPLLGRSTTDKYVTQVILREDDIIEIDDRLLQLDKAKSRVYSLRTLIERLIDRSEVLANHADKCSGVPIGDVDDVKKEISRLQKKLTK